MIHQSSVIDKRAELGKNIKIGPYCYVGKNVKLGDKVQIKSNTRHRRSFTPKAFKESKDFHSDKISIRKGNY